MENFFQVLKACGDVFNESYVIVDYNAEDQPLVYVNQAFLSLTGYSEDEVLNRNCRLLQGKETNPETVQRIREMLQNKGSGWFDVLNYTKVGKPFWNRLTMIAIGGDVEPVQYYLGIQQDVTDLKENSFEAKPESGSLKGNGPGLTYPLTKILNAHRSLKYFNDGSQEDQQKIDELAQQARQEVRKITDYVRNLS